MINWCLCWSCRLLQLERPSQVTLIKLLQDNWSTPKAQRQSNLPVSALKLFFPEWRRWRWRCWWYLSLEWITGPVQVRSLGTGAACPWRCSSVWTLHPDSLGPCVLVCPGFPVYDYDPASLKEALSASVAKVNSQSLSPYLFRAFRSSIKRVSACYLFSILFCFFFPLVVFWGYILKIFQFKKITATHLFRILFLRQKGFNYNCHKALKATSDAWFFLQFSSLWPHFLFPDVTLCF